MSRSAGFDSWGVHADGGEGRRLVVHAGGVDVVEGDLAEAVVVAVLQHVVPGEVVYLPLL